MFDSEKIQRNWDQIQKGITSIWAKVPIDDIKKTQGNLEDIYTVISLYTNDSVEEIEKKFKQLAESYENPTDLYGQRDVSSFERSPLIEDQLDI